MDPEEARIEFLVLVNHEEQYSIWPSHKNVPDGWRRVHGPAEKVDCLAFIDSVWTDMRPLSLRQARTS
jgi:MbtH protein